MDSQLRRCKTICAEHLQNTQRIGGGSFGDIYRARHIEWNTDVAVKKLSRNVSQGLEEVLSEASKMELASPIPNVIRLYGMYEDVKNNGEICHGIVMEYMENGSIASLRNRVNPVPLALKVRILHEVALGMNRLHNLSPPLLHLDLKLSNVLLDSDLHVRIADFGLSRFKRGPSLAPGAAEDYGGTLEYMPPECLCEDVNYRPAQAFDVYSYGILMWAVLSGQNPYPAAHPDIIKVRIPLGDRPDLDQLESEGPVELLEDLKMLMQRCWVMDPLNRPSFRECSAETEKVLSAYKARIPDAVRDVQKILMNMATLSPEDAGFRLEHSPLFGTGDTQRSSSAATSDSHMSSAVEKFKTLHLTESPSPCLEAIPERPRSAASPVPSTPKASHLPKADTEPHPNGHPIGSQQIHGRKDSNIATGQLVSQVSIRLVFRQLCTAHVLCKPPEDPIIIIFWILGTSLALVFRPFAIKACGTNTPPSHCNSYTAHNQSFPSPMTSGHCWPPMSPPCLELGNYQQQPPFMPASSFPGPINISGSVSGLQIGYNNTMNISQSGAHSYTHSHAHERSKKKKK